jgi:hypothetical protein
MIESAEQMPRFTQTDDHVSQDAIHTRLFSLAGFSPATYLAREGTRWPRARERCPQNTLSMDKTTDVR